MENSSNNFRDLIAAQENASSRQAHTNNRIKNFKCSECSTYFSSKHCLIEHGYRHSGQRVYSCTICQKTFKYASQLSVHKKTHKQNLEINWPKLTDLLKREISVIIKEEKEVEKIDLPLIKEPVLTKLPDFRGFGFLSYR